MPLRFNDFIAQLDGPIRTSAATATLTGPVDGANASWSLRERTADVALVPPLNVSVTLNGTQAPQTTWYPIDPALVPVVSRRIASFLSEA
jgi:hypothetical protein